MASLSGRSSQRELISANNPNGIDIPINLVTPLKVVACFRCLRSVGGLKYCNGCRRVVYCGRECQRADWSIWHKNCCKFLKKVNEFEEEDTTRSRTWEQYVKYIMSLMDMYKSESKQDKQTEQQIRHIIRHQPYCTTCHRSAANISQKTTLKPCPKCHMVFTCGECPSTHTEAQCSLYRQCRSDEEFIITRFEMEEPIKSNLPTVEPRKTYIPLSTAKNWFEYYTKISDKEFIQEIMNEDMELLHANNLAGEELMKSQFIRMDFRNATDAGSTALTILSALESTIPDLNKQASLSIHIVGAAHRERQQLMMFEELLHLLPNLKHFHITMAGPDLHIQSQEIITLECCPACTATGRKRTFQGYSGFYHNYAKSEHFKKPDLAVLFHSGRTQEERMGWVPTIRYLVDSETVTLCTTYNEVELKEEVEELREMDVRFLVEPGENVWRSLIVEADFEPGKEHAFFHQNYFWYVFQGKKN